MALSTFSGLKTAVANWTHRDDLYDIAPDFITLVENRINRSLRVIQQEEIALLTVDTTAGYTYGFAALPTDFLAVRTIYVESSPIQELTYVTPNEMDRLSQSGQPLAHYTISRDQIRLDGTSSSNIYLNYYAKVAALSVSNETNWLVDQYPDVYLYGVLAEAFSYCQADDQATKYGQLFIDSIDSLQRSNSTRKSGQSMQIRVA